MHSFIVMYVTVCFCKLSRTYSNNTLLVPGTTTSHSGNMLLSPSHRGISYPPPSPTRWVRVMGVMSFYFGAQFSAMQHRSALPLYSTFSFGSLALSLSHLWCIHAINHTLPLHTINYQHIRFVSDINATLVPSRVPLRRGMAFSTSTKNPPLLKTRNITSQNSINWHQIPSTPTPPSPRSQQLSPGHMHKGSSMQHGMNENQLPLLQKQISHKKPLATATAKEGILGLQRRQSTETDV